MKDTILVAEEIDRADRFFRVEIDGYGYGVRETLPARGDDSGLTVTHFPGFTELIENGSAHKLHSSLATELPDVRVISVASDGIGTTGEKLTAKNFRDHGMKEMGEGRANLLQALVGDEPVIVSGCSMGSDIEQEMLSYDARHGHNLNAYPIGYASAVVPPERTGLTMLALFPLCMALDTPREILRMVIKYGPKHVLSLADMLEERQGDALPLLRQATSLLGGVSIETVKEVAHAYRGGITISGVYDPLRQPDMWREVRSENPDVHIKNVGRRGHGMAADGVGGGKKIAEAIRHYGIDAMLQAA